MLSAPWSEVRRVLSEDSSRVLSDDGLGGEHQDGPVRAGLHVDLGAGASVQQEVWLQLGEARCGEAEVVLPLEWRAIGRERVFPTFAGHLVACEDEDGVTRLSLEGDYSVPLGIIGRFGDGLSGRRLARRSLAGMLKRVAHRVDTDVARHEPSVPPLAPYPVPLTEQDHSEIYVG